MIRTYIEGPLRRLPDGRLVVNARYVDDDPTVKDRTPEVYPSVYTVEGVKDALRAERDKGQVQEGLFKAIQPGEIDLTPAPVIPPPPPSKEDDEKSAYLSKREELRRAVNTATLLNDQSIDSQVATIRAEVFLLYKPEYVSLP